jgi:hypothetical protein
MRRKQYLHVNVLTDGRQTDCKKRVFPGRAQGDDLSTVSDGLWVPAVVVTIPGAVGSVPPVPEGRQRKCGRSGTLPVVGLGGLLVHGIGADQGDNGRDATARSAIVRQ